MANIKKNRIVNFLKEVLLKYGKSDFEVHLDKLAWELAKEIASDIPKFEVSEELKDYYNKETKKENKIIAYELKPDCGAYIEAINKITNVKYRYTSQPTPIFSFGINHPSIGALELAGVLDKWFNPIYKEKTLKIGEHEITFHAANKLACMFQPYILVDKNQAIPKHFWNCAYETSKTMDFTFKYAGENFILKSDFIWEIIENLNQLEK